MTDVAFILQSCTKAIAGEKETTYLLEQKSRLEQAVSSKDPGLTLDTSKALLESIFKTIISDRVAEPNLGQDLSPLYKNVRDVLALNQDAQASDILKRLTNSIVHNVGELRNKYGAASHGDDGCYENPIQMPEAEMIAHLVDGMGGFLYKKHKDLSDPELAQRIYYSDYSEFNDWLDSQNNPIKIPIEEAKEIPFSTFLFTYDVISYRAMLLQFNSTEETDATEDNMVSDVEVTYQVENQEPEIIKDLDEDELQIAHILFQYNESELESEVLSELSQEMAGILSNLRVFEWFKKESAIASVRSYLRVILRKSNYPIDRREPVLLDIVEYLMSQDNPKDELPVE